MASGPPRREHRTRRRRGVVLSDRVGRSVKRGRSSPTGLEVLEPTLEPLPDWPAVDDQLDQLHTESGFLPAYACKKAHIRQRVEKPASPALTNLDNRDDSPITCADRTDFG